jgi:hypothetical protein
MSLIQLRFTENPKEHLLSNPRDSKKKNARPNQNLPVVGKLQGNHSVAVIFVRRAAIKLLEIVTIENSASFQVV